MRKRRLSLVVGWTLLAVGLAGAALFAAQQVSLDYGTVQYARESKTLEVAVERGEFRGRWSLELEQHVPGLKAGQRGTIFADRKVLERRTGRVTTKIAGRDKTLNAIIDWLGSLESRER